jgi:hypothetical protein
MRTLALQTFRLRLLSVVLVSAAALSTGGCGTPRFAFASAAVFNSSTYLLHLPGVAGEQYLDREMLRGLRQGGFDGAMEIFDWTAGDPGLGALTARKRNGRQAQEIADKIEARFREHPGGRIIIVSHSGGTGLAVWALEKLPADVHVDTVLLLSSALSPTYDLSAALRQVRGKVYAFTSSSDALVLGLGTSLFGTIDGKKVEAAGRRGFRRPAGANEAEYEKLVPVPYQRRWVRDGNIGDHIGSISKRFAKNVLARLLLEGEIPREAASAAGVQAEAGGGPSESGGVEGPAPAPPEVPSQKLSLQAETDAADSRKP